MSFSNFHLITENRKKQIRLCVDLGEAISELETFVWNLGEL